VTTLVLIPCEEGRPVSGSLQAVCAAQPLAPLVVLVCGSGAAGAAQELASLPEVTQILTMDAPELPRAEAMAPALVSLQARLRCTHIVAAANAWSRGVMPRTAALLDVMALSEVVKIIDKRTYVRAVHAGAALMTLKSEDPVQILTVRSSAFEAPKPHDGPSAPVEALVVGQTGERRASLLDRSDVQQGDAVGLVGARVVVSGGRGMGTAEGFERLRPLAKTLGAALGASRAAVDAGFAPADSQVGQTGKSVAPDLYLAFGISGAVQHWAGMKDAKVIVAINKDPDAPMFGFSDYYLVADVFDVIPLLQESLAALPPRD
jgi:electron transfer flavoprotein alpha subunit